MSNGQQVERTQQLGLVYVKPMISTGSTTDPKEQAVLGESDGKLSVVDYGKDSGGTARAMRTDSSGRQEIINTGSDGSTNRTFKTETTGEQDIVFHGKDSANNIDPVRTNENKQLFYELYEKWIPVPPVLLTGSDAVLWDPGLTANDTLLVELIFYNISAGNVTATAYFDWDASGGVSNNEYLLNAESITAKQERVVVDAVIPGNIILRGSAGSTDSINLRFRIRQVSRT